MSQTMREDKSALDRRVDSIKHAADKAPQDFEIERNDFEDGCYVTVRDPWNEFEIRLGPRGGLKRANYRTSGWGEGNVVDDEDTKSEAWSWMLSMIEHPHPYDN